MKNFGASRLAVLTRAFPPFACSESDFVFQLCDALTWRGMNVRAITPQPVSVPRGRVEVRRASTLLGTVTELLSLDVDGLLVPYQPWLFREVPAYVKAVQWVRRMRPTLPMSLLVFNPDALTSKQESFFSAFSRVVVLSERHAWVLRQKLPHLKASVEIIPPFSMVPDEGVRCVPYDGTSVFRWLSLGFVYPGKGIETLLKAFARLTPDPSKARITFVGGNLEVGRGRWNEYAKCLRLLADSLGIGPCVEWRGGYRNTRDFPQRALAESHAAVVPFDVGLGINNSCLATLTRAGLPIVSTRGSFLDSDLVPEENCYLVPCRKPKELARAMALVQADAALRERLSRGALALSLRQYDSTRIYDEWGRILHRDMASSLAGAPTPSFRSEGTLIPGYT